ncbi:MAG: glycosyltransferase [Flavipsychrobacter sp.]
MRLLIISHTSHFYDENGQIVGWGPTIREMDYLAERFGEVVHVACLHKNVKAPASSVPYGNKNVRYVPIPSYGGENIKEKISIITNAFTILKTIAKELKHADVFQFRAPTAMGMYVIPYLSIFSNKKGWYKYAGNWVREVQPFSYTFQRSWLLKRQKRKITINGSWENQPSKCLSFENPCLDNEDRKLGSIVVQSKVYAKPLVLCFVGRLDKEKGVYNMLDAIKRHPDKSSFVRLDIVGDSAEKAEMEEYAKDVGLPIIFHGALPRAEVFEIYKQSHLLLLPSQSEGFPKVVAEAANFGCIPVVSDVSSIGQYVKQDNGFLWESNKQSFEDFFIALDFDNEEILKEKAKKTHEMAGLFTFERYLDKLEKEVIG